MIVGDTNINCLDADSTEWKMLSDVLSAHGMVAEVDFPTRVTEKTATCLDQAYSNLPAGTVRTAPISTDLSDHLCVRIEVRCESTVSKPTVSYTRSFSQENNINFVMSLDSMDWSKVLQGSKSAANKATSVINVIRNKFEASFPLRKKNNYTRKKQTWVTEDVKNLKSFLFDIIELGKLNPNDEFMNFFISDIRNKYDDLLTNTKSKYYSNIIEKSGNMCKTMWKVVNLERGKSNFTDIDFTKVIMNSDGTTFSCEKEALNAFNSRLLSAATACGAPRADVTCALYKLNAARPPADRSLRFLRFSADEVYKLITSRIPPKTAKDIYGLNMKSFRIAAVPLAPVLAELFNSCIWEGYYPEILKATKVSPIFKGKGKREDMDAYRPVSIIPAVAKIFENGLSSRLITFLSDTDQVTDRQYAYRAGRSTTSLARELVRRIVGARERKQQVAVICCDLSKAFDVADHDVLATKLQHYGIRGAALALVTSILQGRSQIVAGSGGTIKSDPLRSSMGVAQGSSVSNVLFSVLLNDLPDAITSAEILMYADDVAALVVAPTVDELEGKLNDTSYQLESWFRINGLALNLSKTHYAHFNLSGKKYRRLQVLINGVIIKQTEVTNFLGFEIDTALSWENHINKICGKIASACFALRRVARVVSVQVARTCYFATVHSLLQYGAELYGLAAEWERAFRLQKRAIRSIVGIKNDQTAAPHFKKLGILTLPCILILQVAVYVRSNLHMYAKYGDQLAPATRRAGKLMQISRGLVKSDKLTHIMGPTVYNKLPAGITSAPNLLCFKNRLKRWLVEQTFYSYKEFLDSNVEKCTVVQ